MNGIELGQSICDQLIEISTNSVWPFPILWVAEFEMNAFSEDNSAPPSAKTER